jgi:hypothetical protein
MDGAIMVQLPAENPRLVVVAEFPGSARGSADFESSGDWNKVLSFSENGYGVTIYRRTGAPHE